MGEWISAKIAPGGRNPSSRLRNRLASATRCATKSPRVRTSERSALISLEHGRSGRKHWPPGAQYIGEHVSVTRIALATSSAVAGPGRLDDVGMDWRDQVASFDQEIDDQAIGWRRVCGDLQMLDDTAAIFVDDPDGMRAAASIQTDAIAHISGPPKFVRLTRAGRSCGSLID